MAEWLKRAVAKHPERYGIEVAEAVIREAITRIEPTGILSEGGGWENYETEVLTMIDGQPIDLERIRQLRMGVEYLKTDSPDAELLIAALKLALSGWMVASANDFSELIPGRELIHDDIDPLVQKAVVMLELALEADVDCDADFEVEWDDTVMATVEEKNDKARMRHIIDNAIRPENN